MSAVPGVHLQVVPRDANPGRRARPLAGVFYPDTLWRVMASNAWFACLDETTQGELIGHSVLSNLPAGAALVPDGSQLALAGLVRGVLKVTCGGPSQRHTIELLEPGQWLAPLQAGPADGPSWGIRAMRPSTVLTLHGSALRELALARPDLPEALARLNWDFALRLVERCETVSIPAYEERVRRALALLARRFGERLADGWWLVRPKFNQSEIAALARVSRARTNKVLNELSGLVRSRDGNLELAPSFVPRRAGELPEPDQART